MQARALPCTSVSQQKGWRVARPCPPAADQPALPHALRPRSLGLPPTRQALGLRPEDVFTAEMLAEAMEEASLAFEAELRRGASPGPGAAGAAPHMGFVAA